MGIIRPGPPVDLITSLQKAYNIRAFVETGTYRGDTSRWASRVFDKVWTIENSESIYLSTVEACKDLKNVDFLFGDTRNQLPMALSQLSGPAIFWLDAHWSCDVTYGEGDECPLRDELKLLNESPFEHYILIDDAKYFMSPPPPPHNREQWPTLTSVLTALNTPERSRYVVIHEDVIIAVPKSSETVIADYCTTYQLSESGPSMLLGARAVRAAKTLARKVVPNRKA